MKKLNLSCPINSTGYGIVSTNILKALSEYYSISYFPIGQPTANSKEEHDELVALLGESSKITNVDILSPFLKIWHQFDLGDHFGKGEYYAFPFFELDTFNDLEKKHLSVPDTIFVTSEWARQVIQDNGIKTKTHIVPLGVNTKIFNHNIPKSIYDNKYIFLTIGKWEIRKSHDIIPELFKKAFPNEEDVELHILAAEHTNNYSSKEEIEKWRSLYSAPNIKVIGGVQQQSDVAQLISNSDCGLYISRAEGWNLELLETMAMNKPAIATNYSAHTEFCTKENSLLVDISEKEKAIDNKAFYGQGNWAKIGAKEQDQIIDYMRYVYNNKINTNEEGVKTAKTYSWKNSANKILRCIG